jgi:hypothetical protein
MVIDNKAWSDSLTAVVRQLYHSSKATVKQLSVWGLHERILRANVAIVEDSSSAISTSSPHRLAAEDFARGRV